jgi:ribosomal protein L19E
MNNLRMKKRLIANVMKIGLGRVILNESRLDEIKEAITRQDILDLIKDKAITIRSPNGRKKKAVSRRRHAGSIRKKVKSDKEDYVQRVRKYRDYISNLKKQKKISNEKYNELRKKIKQNTLKSIKQLINETKTK